MKGVVLSRTDGRLVDVAHDLPRQDVRAAAFWLRETLPYFPPAVHLVVVDPGVGTDRRAVVLRVGDHVFVGPDNGVLRPPARRVAAELDDDAPVEAYEIDVPNPESTTFHGRDVFAPAAADAHVAGASALGSVDRFETDSRRLALRVPPLRGDRLRRRPRGDGRGARRRRLRQLHHERAGRVRPRRGGRDRLGERRVGPRRSHVRGRRARRETGHGRQPRQRRVRREPRPRRRGVRPRARDRVELRVD